MIREKDSTRVKDQKRRWRIGKVLVPSSTPTEVNMKDRLKTSSLRVKVDLLILITISIKVSGQKEKPTERVCLFSQFKESCTTVNGTWMIDLAKELRFGTSETLLILVDSKTVKKRVKVSFKALVLNMKVDSIMACLMEREPTQILSKRGL